MDADTQIDLAKEEVPAEQAWDSPLQHTTTHLSVPRSLDADPRPPSSRSSRGAHASTYQVRLKPRSKSPAEQLSHHQSRRTGQADFDSFDEKDIGQGQHVVQLPPVDGGFGAWSYVYAAFSMYIVVWGFPYAFPIFQTHFSTGPDARFKDSITLRLLAPGLQDIEEGLLFPFLPKAYQYRRPIVVLGIFVVIMSLLIAANASAAWEILLFQGITFGVGGILMNFVHVSIFPEWFDAKRGQAMGIIWSGWRVGALGLPLICQWLLDTHGYQTTIYVLIAPFLSLLLPSVLLLRGRYHGVSVTEAPRPTAVSKLQALRAPSVLYYLVATSMFFLVVNIPNMFIGLYTSDLGLTGADQALAYVCLTLSDMMGTYALGWLSDHVHHEVLTGLLAISVSFLHIIGFGYARSRVAVFLYSVAVGLAGGGFSNCLFTFYGDLSHGDGELFTAIHGLFSFFRGLSILSVGPIGANLLRRGPALKVDQFALGRYLYLLIYASSLSLASGVLIISRQGWQRLRTQR